MKHGSEDQPDLFGAKQARDEALNRVSANAGERWLIGGLRMISALRDWRGTGEDLRLHLLRTGLERPHHHNAWGALIKMAVNRCHLVPTGQYAHMATVKSHGRRTAVYRSRNT